MTEQFFDFRRMPSNPSASALDALFAECPAQFKDAGNPWHQLAAKMRNHRGANGTDWKWRDRTNVDQKMAWLTLMTIVLDAGDQQTAFRQKTVAAWILWSMLETLPEFVRATMSENNRAARG